MAYLTPVDLLSSPGIEEIARRATAEHLQPVSVELMQLTITGGDVSGYPSDEVANAADALARIQVAIAEAEEVINGHLRGGGYSLPLNPVPSLIKMAMRRVTRRLLAKDADPESGVERDYQDTLKLLLAISRGAVKLGVGAAPAAGGSREVLISTGARAFTDKHLANY